MTEESSDGLRQDRRAFLKATGAVGAGVLLPHAASATPQARAAAADDFAQMDATALAAAIRARRISPAEALDAAIARAEATADLNCLSEKLYDRARARLRSIDLSAPFAGVPILMKAEEDLAGTRKSYGSQLDRVAPVSTQNGPFASAIDRLGFSIFARTTMSEFGALPTTETIAYGVTRNPWSLNHTPGGSSGGAAAAVAAGVVPLAHAADGAGSIRIPASNCGLVGLKPTRGRVPDAPPLLPHMALAVPLCLSRSVRDTANFLAMVERKDRDAPYPPVGTVTGPAQRRLRIGLIINGLSGAMPEMEVLRALDAASRPLIAEGHTVREVRWPFDGKAFLAGFTQIYALEGRAMRRRIFDDTGVTAAQLTTLIEPASRAIAALADMIPPQADQQIIDRVADPLRAYINWFNSVDVVMSAVLLKPPVAVGEINGSLPLPTLIERLGAYADFTMIQNASGGPAISVPVYRTPEGLPIGVQFAAKPGDERVLLELAFELERLIPWGATHPPVWAPSRVQGTQR